MTLGSGETETRACEARSSSQPMLGEAGAVCGRRRARGESAPRKSWPGARGEGLVSEGWARRARRACWASGGRCGGQGQGESFLFV